MVKLSNCQASRIGYLKCLQFSKTYQIFYVSQFVLQVIRCITGQGLECVKDWPVSRTTANVTIQNFFNLLYCGTRFALQKTGAKKRSSITKSALFNVIMIFKIYPQTYLCRGNFKSLLSIKFKIKLFILFLHLVHEKPRFENYFTLSYFKVVIKFMYTM